MGAPIVVCSDCGLDWALHDTELPPRRIVRSPLVDALLGGAG